MTTRRQRHSKTLRMRSKMPIGINKGFTVAYLIKSDPEYLARMSRYGYIRLSGSVTDVLKQKLLGDVKH